MTQPGLRQIVRDFVKGPLGCQCPDELFQKTEVLMGDNDLRIFIEQRLIVRLLPFGKKTMSISFEQLLKIFKNGLQERDLKGFNRFRLVLLYNTEEGTKERLEHLSTKVQEAFKKTSNDDRMHIHVIDEKDVPEILKVMAGMKVQ